MIKKGKATNGLSLAINHKIRSSVEDYNRVRSVNGQEQITLSEDVKTRIKENLIKLAQDDNFIAACSPGNGAPITRDELLDALLQLHLLQGKTSTFLTAILMKISLVQA